MKPTVVAGGSVTRQTDKTPLFPVVMLLGVALLVIAALLVFRYWGEIEVDSLVDKFYEEAQHNKAYCPSKDEIREWLKLIGRESRLVENPELFYAALILAESSGNPTTKTDGGMTRGLMCIQVDAARDVIKRRGFKVDNIAIALYNPRWNIIIGIDHYEHLLAKWGDARWSMTMYNAGERKVTGWVSRGVGIKHSHYSRVCDKIELLKGERK